MPSSQTSQPSPQAPRVGLSQSSSTKRDSCARPIDAELRRGRLGKARPWALGLGWEGLARRHGGQPVHLFPAGRRDRMRPVSTELTYGLERLAMYCREGERLRPDYNGLPKGRGGISYGDVFLRGEREFSAYNFRARRHRNVVFAISPTPERECGALLNLGDAPVNRPPLRAARLRPVPEGEPPVQPPRRAAASSASPSAPPISAGSRALARGCCETWLAGSTTA